MTKKKKAYICSLVKVYISNSDRHEAKREFRNGTAHSKEAAAFIWNWLRAFTAEKNVSQEKTCT